jgi:hypothetical protein
LNKGITEHDVPNPNEKEEDLDKHFAMQESEEDDAEVDMQVYIQQYEHPDNIRHLIKMYPTKIINAILGKESAAKERAIRWIHKHLNDEVDPDLDFISNKVNATLEVSKISIEDKALKVIMRGLELLEALSISDLLDCEYGFQVFARTLVEGDLV